MVTDPANIMSPIEAILSDPSQVWLTSYYGFTPEDWGFFSFSDRGRAESVVEQSKSGFIVVIYGTKGGTTPKPQQGKVIGFYQCSLRTGAASEFMSPLGMDRKQRLQKKDGQWDHGIEAVRAWRVTPESYIKVEDFAPDTYDPKNGRSISRFGTKLAPLEAKKLLHLDVEECDVYGNGLDGVPMLGKGLDVLSNTTPRLKPSKAGPVSKSPFKTKESEGPKHLYMLELTGPLEYLFDTIPDDSYIVKIGFSKSPETRCDQYNKTLPDCKLRWIIRYSTYRESIEPYPSSSHALAGEDEMKIYLDRFGRSLGGEFFIADEQQISSAWDVAKKTASEYSP